MSARHPDAVPPRRRLAPAAVFILLTCVWGSSYFFTELALESLAPVAIAALRLAIATLVLGGAVLALRLPFPRRLRDYLAAAAVGVGGIAVPIVAVTEAQRHVGASLSTVLISMTPIFVFVISVARRRARFAVGTAVGVVVAFAGVAALAFVVGTVDDVPWGWSLVVVACAALFAVGNVAMVELLRGMHLVMLVFLELGIASAGLLLVVVATGALPVSWPTPLALLGILELGVFGSALGYVMFSYLLHAWGSTSTSIITYLQPVVGLLLGAVVLREPISAPAWAAVVVTLVGVLVFALASVRSSRRSAPLVAGS